MDAGSVDNLRFHRSWDAHGRAASHRVGDVAVATETHLGSKPSASLQMLVERVEEAAADPVYAGRKEMWTRHLRREKVAKAPVYALLVGSVSVAWQELIPPDIL